MIATIHDQSYIPLDSLEIETEHIPRVGDRYRTGKGIAKVVDVIWSTDFTSADIYVDRD